MEYLLFIRYIFLLINSWEYVIGDYEAQLLLIIQI